MNELLRRIAIHGGLTAILVGIVGVVLGDMAASSVLTPTGARTPAARSAEEAAALERSAESLRKTVPLAMAIWGFGFVALYEGARHLMRGKKAPTEPPATQQPDETEKLLEELLSQAEAKSAMASTGDLSAMPAESPVPAAPR
jgi:hypothetical protein